jgi:hypothetical protein
MTIASRAHGRARILRDHREAAQFFDAAEPSPRSQSRAALQVALVPRTGRTVNVLIGAAAAPLTDPADPGTHLGARRP